MIIGHIILVTVLITWKYSSISANPFHFLQNARVIKVINDDDDDQVNGEPEQNLRDFLVNIFDGNGNLILVDGKMIMDTADYYIMPEFMRRFLTRYTIFKITGDWIPHDFGLEYKTEKKKFMWRNTDFHADRSLTNELGMIRGNISGPYIYYVAAYADRGSAYLFIEDPVHKPDIIVLHSVLTHVDEPAIWELRSYNYDSVNKKWVGKFGRKYESDVHFSLEDEMEQPLLVGTVILQ